METPGKWRTEKTHGLMILLQNGLFGEVDPQMCSIGRTVGQVLLQHDGLFGGVGPQTWCTMGSSDNSEDITRNVFTGQ